MKVSGKSGKSDESSFKVTSVFGSLGFFEIAAIAGVIVLVIGHRRIPRLAREVGTGLRGLVTGLVHRENSPDGK